MVDRLQYEREREPVVDAGLGGEREVVLVLVLVAGRHVAGVGPGYEGLERVDVSGLILLPGFVNAHTHLELSWMHGRVPPSDSMPRWAGALMALRRSVSAEPDEPIVEAIRRVARGESLYRIYCTPCHGPGGKGDGPVWETPEGIAVRL